MLSYVASVKLARILALLGYGGRLLVSDVTAIRGTASHNSVIFIYGAADLVILSVSKIRTDFGISGVDTGLRWAVTLSDVTAISDVTVA
jgi:hypothetical protein